MSLYLLSTANFAGLMALVAISYGIATRNLSHRLVRNIVLGLILGFGAAAASLQPVMHINGIQIDPRNLFVGCAGAFVGPLAGLISFVMAAVTRYYEDQPLAIVCIVSLFVATCAGLAWRHFTRNQERTSRKLLVGLGLTISLSYVCTFLLPRSYWGAVFSSAVPFLVVTNIIGTTVLGGFLERERRRARRWRRLQAQASIDPLTGLLNRRAFEAAYATVTRTGTSKDMAFLLVDLDNFKKVNDVLGHAGGDKVLIAAARKLSTCVRDGDLVARFGGEEFAVCLPSSTLEQAAAIAQRIRAAISELDMVKARNAPPTTASIGVCWGAATLRLEDAFEIADRALYRAKVEGRDQVVFGEHEAVVARPAIAPWPSGMGPQAAGS
ncbi:GGDEF domain-containing protein [Pseudooceanicola sediminis]|uniref:diguanylate cyclase n=1 Tax=Pseudooceanicola sediminis TaxID=2211117 RepID=A0A399J418_9RHOB|nr:diguanylate cyclase [Pseudooceanicola sediminis]KAA2314689.1 diguanylate cyclase [Puniceibacterium sp. HSS470]RII39357.1 GGDEF domain-containing protein [Pseudooceanicola sediminis]|tara:strand:- start:209774 stop:210919 length:1146 start_codon:yes stop_codon:yes gene_type:complete